MHIREKHGEHAPETHVTPLWIYLSVFGALLAGTALTVMAAQVDLGAMNTPVAMAIATAKAVLVILFFMHLIYSNRLTWVVVVASFIWLGILFLLTFSDYLTRLWAIY
ncbi:MAG TPA: cytochrome C oxidase subunit IV family protein [Thermoanaerobaculia bacterium]|nr:cytochrome C oxidase subunit IV family protein [Thermoanaerobaculia bacterium]